MSSLLYSTATRLYVFSGESTLCDNNRRFENKKAKVHVRVSCCIGDLWQKGWVINMEKIVVVTGVASGIGKCVAENLVKKGNIVYGADIKFSDIDSMCYRKCDVCDEKQVIEFINEIKVKHGKIDGLINIAGILCDKNRATVEDLSVKEWDTVLKTNAYSVFFMTKYAIPLLKKSKVGSIVNISSDQVKKVRKKSAPYAISKAAIEMLTKIVALELLEYKVRVNAIELASVNTDFIKNYFGKIKMKKMLQNADEEMPYGIISTDDVWRAIQYLLEENNKMTGQILLIDSGTTL